MNIRYASMEDLELLLRHDVHVRMESLRDSIEHKRILIAEADGRFVGWLRYNLFWDIVPFMNMLHFEPDARGKGYGRQLTRFWEDAMRGQGYKNVMTSSQSDEYGQHFYVKQGYRAIGSFMLEGDPLEILFEKQL